MRVVNLSKRYLIGVIATIVFISVVSGYANACRRTSLPQCVSVVSCGPSCVKVVNNCNISIRWHLDLRGFNCPDKTGWTPPYHQTTITYSCRLRAVTWC